VGIRIQIRVWVRVRGRVRVSNNTFTHPFASSSYLRRGTSDVLVLVLVLSWSRGSASSYWNEHNIPRCNGKTAAAAAAARKTPTRRSDDEIGCSWPRRSGRPSSWTARRRSEQPRRSKPTCTVASFGYRVSSSRSNRPHQIHCVQKCKPIVLF